MSINSAEKFNFLSMLTKNRQFLIHSAHLQSENLKPEAEYVLDSQHSSG